MNGVILSKTSLIRGTVPDGEYQRPHVRLEVGQDPSARKSNARLAAGRPSVATRLKTDRRS
jgi:hypothetical protein